MRSQIAAISRACVCSALGVAVILSIATIGTAMGITEALRPVPIAKTQDRIIASVPSFEPVAVPHLNDPWAIGVIWAHRAPVPYIDETPWIRIPVQTIKYTKPPEKKQKRSSVEDIIKSAPRAALLAYAQAQIGKRGPQLGLPASLYCADFINWVMRKVGLPGSASRMARSFIGHPNFVRVAKPVPGDIVVISRGRSSVYGHVALYNGSCGKGGIRMLGGNQGGGRVTNQCVYTRAVVGYVRPRAIANDSIQIASNDKPPPVVKATPRVAKVKARVRVAKRIKRSVRHAEVEKQYWTRES